MTIGSFSRKCFFDMLLIFISNISNKQHQRCTVNSLVCFVRSIQPVTGPYKKGEGEGGKDHLGGSQGSPLSRDLVEDKISVFCFQFYRKKLVLKYF